MIAFLVDHNFNEHIVDGLTRREAALEFTHVRDVGTADFQSIRGLRLDDWLIP